MGTRADFYVGRGEKTMEWLGSVAWDGHPENFEAILKAKTEKAPCPNCEHGKGKAWVLPGVERDEDGYVEKHEGVADFPSMKGRAAVAEPGSKRSGVMVFGVRR